MSEADVQSQCIQVAELRGGVVTRINSGIQVIKGEGGKNRVFRGAEKGTSDLHILHCGWFIACECKYGRNTATPEQVVYLERIGAAGGVGLVAWDCEDLLAVLDDIDADRMYAQVINVPPWMRLV